MAIARLLLVDDDEMVLCTVARLLEADDFEVTTAANVPDALKLILSDTFDLLISDLHMPGAGDGLTVVSAMRHANPKAVTMLLSAFPEMDAAAHAILAQTDEILIKPMATPDLVEAIKQRLATGAPRPRVIESLATILERFSTSIIEDWYAHVETERVLMAIPMVKEQRCGHLPEVFIDLVYRLRYANDLGTKELISVSSTEHGVRRFKQGYSAAMLVEESRQLQVSIFRGLQANLSSIDFSVVLTGVMTIADEIDSQLSQAMTSYIAESVTCSVPAA